jgi:hypothetical protein
MVTNVYRCNLWDESSEAGYGGRSPVEWNNLYDYNDI